MEKQILQPRMMYFKFLETSTVYLTRAYASEDQGGLRDTLEVAGYSVIVVDEMTIEPQGPYYSLKILKGNEACAILSNVPFESRSEMIEVPEGSTLYPVND